MTGLEMWGPTSLCTIAPPQKTELAKDYFRADICEEDLRTSQEEGAGQNREAKGRHGPLLGTPAPLHCVLGLPLCRGPWWLRLHFSSGFSPHPGKHPCTRLLFLLQLFIRNYIVSHPKHEAGTEECPAHTGHKDSSGRGDSKDKPFSPALPYFPHHVGEGFHNPLREPFFGEAFLITLITNSESRGDPMALS